MRGGTAAIDRHDGDSRRSTTRALTHIETAYIVSHTFASYANELAQRTMNGITVFESAPPMLVCARVCTSSHVEPKSQHQRCDCNHGQSSAGRLSCAGCSITKSETCMRKSKVRCWGRVYGALLCTESVTCTERKTASGGGRWRESSVVGFVASAVEKSCEKTTTAGWEEERDTRVLFTACAW